MIATPAYGHVVRIEHAAAVMATVLHLDRRGIKTDWVSLPGQSLISRCRNVGCAHFLVSDATHLLFVDADISLAGS